VPVSSSVQGREFRFERVFRASLDAVRAAFVDPATVTRWFGPAPFTNHDVVWDARSGGALRVVMRSPAGDDYPLVGAFDVVEDDRIALTLDTREHPASWHAAFAEAVGAPTEPPVIETEVAFEAVGGGTRFTLTQRWPTPEQAAASVRLGSAEGWASSCDRLDVILATAAPPEDVLVLQRTIRASRERVFAAFSRPEAVDAWWGPDGFVTRTTSMRFERGGEWRFTMTHPSWGTFPNRMRYDDLIAPERIAGLHDDGEGTSGHRFVIWLEVVEPALTRVTLMQVHPDVAAKQRVQEFGAVELGYQTLARLAAAVEG
jgi:uncharacterized protein YndB with AHSA1/START domain